MTIDSLLPLALVGATAGVVAPLVAGGIALRARRETDEYRDKLAKVPGLQYLDTLDEQLADRRRELAQIEERAANARALAQEEQALQERVAKRQAELQAMAAKQQELERLQTELDAARRELADIQAKHESLQGQRSELDRAIAESKQRAEELKNARQRREFEADKAASRLVDTREELGTVRAELEAARQSLADTEAARLRHEAAAERLATVQTELKKRLEKLTPEVEALRSESRDLSQERHRLKATLSELADEHEELKTQCRELKTRRDELDVTVSELTEGEPDDVTRTRADEILRDLWSPVLTSRTLSSGDQEEDLVRGFRERLEAEGLVFPERVVHAFHTTLKVGRESPLVVLAGISGTGKSLLPQRYAETMGMQFQLVPVQPRWDGPQDLIGFFNYLQKRFVATEFSRALVQMAEHREDFSPFTVLDRNGSVGSHGDQMLLVLLDEMNIARVEYYFSELLSRLEIRRTIDDTVPAERARAAIEIETGPEVRGSLKVHLGSNVLFVGTMNEDESTQSLADKVVDRANILRFGRPAKLAGGEPTESGGPPTIAAPRQQALPARTWRTWLEDGATKGISPDEEARVGGWVDKLNEALSQIRKPFGHRQSAAIMSYVRQYPQWVTDRVQVAVADQIEQRILPKLRGEDLTGDGSRAVEDVLAIVDDLGDRQLADAIAAARDSDDQMFHWEGVQRSQG